MKTQAYSLFSTWIFVLLLTIIVILPQTAFGQMHSNTVTSNTDIKNLESKLKDNLNSIEMHQMGYNNTKEHYDELINYYGNEVAELLVTHYEAIKNAESYDRRYYADIIKLHRYAITEFISRYHKQREDNKAHMLDLKEKIDKLKKENTRLQKELTALIANTTNQSYTPGGLGNKRILHDGSSLITGGNILSERKRNLDKIQKEKVLLKNGVLLIFRQTGI